MMEGDGRWHLGVGDPTFLAWGTVAAYLVAAVACYRAYATSRAQLRRAGPEADREARALALLWLGLGGMMLALGVNKQLDLQTLLTEVARDLAKAEGWYEQRRGVQRAFIGALAVGGALVGVVLARGLGRTLRRIWLALAGVAALIVFVVVRAASFHRLDTWLRAGPIHMAWVLELSGIAMIGAAAHRFRRQSGSRDLPEADKPSDG